MPPFEGGTFFFVVIINASGYLDKMSGYPAPQRADECYQSNPCKKNSNLSQSFDEE